MRPRVVIALVVGVAVIATSWWLLSRPSSTLELPTVPAISPAEPPSPVPLQPTTRIAPRPFAEAVETVESRNAPASRAAVPSGKARLEIPILDAEGGPATSRVFDLVTTPGLQTAEELAREEVMIAMTMGSTMSVKLVKATTSESGINADGVALCEVPADMPGHLRIREAPAGSKVSHFPGGTIKWLAIVAFDAIPSGETRRLDAVQLPRVPLLVAGRVETETGHPVTGAVVEVALAGPPAANRDLVRKIEGLGARTAADGTFRVESDATAPEFLAWAHVEGALASQVASFEPKQTDLVLRVRATGSLKGRIRASPSLGGETPGLTLEPESIVISPGVFSGRWSPRPWLSVKKTGALLCEGIPAGTYRLIVSISITRVMTIDGIVIEPGKVDEDPRIADLIVGEKLRLGVVRVVNGNGRPVRGATVYWQSVDQEGVVHGSHTSQTNESGESTLPLPEDAVMTIRVEARGFQPWVGERVSLPLSVNLDAGARVAITLPGSRDWAKPNGVSEYLLCLLPEGDVDAARRDSRNPIPSKIHSSQSQPTGSNKDEYVFQGVAPGRMVAFIVPRKTETGRTVMVGESIMLHGEEGLEIGRLDLDRGKASESVVYRVDVDKLIALSTK